MGEEEAGPRFEVVGRHGGGAAPKKVGVDHQNPAPPAAAIDGYSQRHIPGDVGIRQHGPLRQGAPDGVWISKAQPCDASAEEGGGEEAAADGVPLGAFADPVGGLEGEACGGAFQGGDDGEGDGGYEEEEEEEGRCP